MATTPLDSSQRSACSKEIMAIYSADLSSTGSLTKANIRTCVDNIDDYVSRSGDDVMELWLVQGGAQWSAFLNEFLHATARTTLTDAQKIQMVETVMRHRAKAVS